MSAEKKASTLTDRERADYELLGRAKVIIEWLLDRPGEDSTAYARTWLERYEQQMKETVWARRKQSDSQSATQAEIATVG